MSYELVHLRELRAPTADRAGQATSRVRIRQWQICGTGLLLERLPYTSRWIASADDDQTGRWLARHLLRNVTFASRTEALRVLAALHADTPAPHVPEPSVQLTRTRTGSYRTADCAWFVQPAEAGGWHALRLEAAYPPARSNWIGTLHEARCYIARHRSARSRGLTT